MKQIEEKRAQHLLEHGVSVSLLDPEGEDLCFWTVSIQTEKVDATTELGKQLRDNRAEQIELELWIPDAFPAEPPKVRAVRPSFSIGSFFVLDYGALCLEILTKQGWSPAMTLLQLGVQIKQMMSEGKGTVSSLQAMDSSNRQAAWKRAARIESAHDDWKHFKMG